MKTSKQQKPVFYARHVYIKEIVHPNMNMKPV